MLRIGIEGDQANVPEPAGIEMYVCRLLEALGRIDRENRYHVYLRRRPRPHFPPLPPNFTFRVIPVRYLWHQVGIPLWQLFDRNDVLLFPVHRFPLLFPVRTRIVGTIHDTAFLHHARSYPPFRRARLRLFTRVLARRADRLIAISRATAEDIEHDYRIPRERISVIHQGWDRELAEPVGETRIAGARARYGLSRPYVLTIGALRPGKNLERLVQAFARMLAMGGDAAEHDLVLIGKEDWPFGAVSAAVRRVGLSERVHLLGYVPREELKALLQGAAAFVFPSLHEGFGLPPLEAFGAGIPVLTSRSGSLPEIVGDAAYPFNALDPEDMALRLREVLSDPGLQARLVAAGRVQAERFSWEETARRTLQVFREVAAT